MPRCPALNALFRPVVWHEWTLQMGYMRPAPTRPAVPALLTPAKHSSPQHLPSFVVGNKKRVGAYPPAPVNQPKTRRDRSERPNRVAALIVPRLALMSSSVPAP